MMDGLAVVTDDDNRCVFVNTIFKKNPQHIITIITIHRARSCVLFRGLYYYKRNYCNLIGLEQWHFSLI